ncbi:galanin receptor type 1-like [Branchiostoma floridae x Branchiostoma belcheri]
MAALDDFERAEKNVSNSTGANVTVPEPYVGAAAILENLAVSVPTILTYAVCFLLGTVGNVLVVFSVARFRRLRSTTNYLLGNLATADLLIVALCVPVKAAEFFLPAWELGGFLCKATALLQFLSVICSVLTLTCISIERYYGILHPMKARAMFMYGKARRAVAVIWVLSLLLASPSLVIQGLVGYDWGTGDTIYHCQQVWASVVYERLYVLYGLLVLFLLPLAIMGFSYGCVIWEIVQRRRGQSSESEQEENVENQRKMMSFRRFSEHLRRTLQNPEVVGAAENMPHGPRMTSMQLETITQGNADENSSTNSRKPSFQVLGDENGLQIMKMLLVVMAVFVSCWGPLLILHTLVTFNLLDEHTQHVYAMRIAFRLLSYLNSCANPVCYAFMSHSFRISFRQAISSCGKRRASCRGGNQPSPRGLLAANLPIPEVLVQHLDVPSLAEGYSLQRTQGTPLGTPLGTPDRQSVRGANSEEELHHQLKSVEGTFALDHGGGTDGLDHAKANGQVHLEEYLYWKAQNAFSFVTSV